MLCGVSCAVVLGPTSALALELGFEAGITFEATDNVENVGSEFEETGQIGFASIGIYGEQRGRIVQGAFTGEIETEKTLSDSDDDFDALTRFIGAVNVGITPQSVSWYFGDILGAVRADDANQSVDVSDLPRRNVFVTGPSVQFNTGSFSSADSRLLYVHQSDEEGELASLINFTASWRTETQRGNTFGVRFGDIYTDNPALTDNNPGVADAADFNRLTSSVFWERERGRNSVSASLGATHYATDDDSLTGLNAGVSFTRLLGPQRSFTIALDRDLRDQNLDTIESLIADGSGEEPVANGVFEETRLALSYSLITDRSSIEVGAGLSMADYQALSGINSSVNINDEDQLQPFVFGVWTRSYNPRLRSELSLNYEQLEYDNLRDESSSITLSAMMSYRLSRSFTAELGYVFDQIDGLRTRGADGISITNPQDIDIVENSARVSLRWAPPSRASKALTIELKSLLN